HAQYLRQSTALTRNLLLTEVHDRNEVLFYRLLVDNLPEMLPIVYTPTVGEAIENYSHEYRRPRGVYLSVDHPDLIEKSLGSLGLEGDEVDLIVATDGGAILGIGDWGVGGIHIAVGKLVVYTAAGGIDPNRILPVMLDVGTDRQSLLDDPLYIGNRHPRVSAADTTPLSTPSSRRSASSSPAPCCTGRTSPSATPGGCSSATGGGCCLSTTTS